MTINREVYILPGCHAWQVLSCIPMCLSSVYKEKALGDDDMDVIYLNGWVAVFQLMASLLFAVPSAYAMGLPVAVMKKTNFAYLYICLCLFIVLLTRRCCE